MPLGTQSASQPRLMWPVCCLSDFLYTIPQKTLAPRAGIEPATIRLTGECSTAELPWNSIFSIAPVCAAEPRAAPCRQHQQPRLF